MKIVDMIVTPVAFKDPPLRNSTGVHQPYALRTIIQLITEEGIVGVGEAYGGEEALQSFRRLRERVLGEDPFCWERLSMKIEHPRHFSPIEVACLDIIGKALGRPVCDLLGGAVRDKVPFSAYLFYKFAGDDEWGEVLTPEAMVGEAKRFVELYGFQTLKLKGGVLPPEEEIETLRLLRQEFGPEYKLRIDPNGIWSVPTAIRVARLLEEVGLEYLEDPTQGLEGMAEVRRNVSVPLATNAVVTRWEHIRPAIEHQAVDVVLTDHHYWGGLWATKHLAQLCKAVGWGVSMHSNSHLGVSLSAMVHIASAIPNLDHACDTHYPWQEEDILVGGRFRFVEGCLVVPKGPGLGIEVDLDQLARMEETYYRVGIIRRDDVSEMRKYIPDWEPLCPRW